MNYLPKSLVSSVLICALAGLVSVSCFKKGEGKGKRKLKPAAATVGDVFVPGPGNKPGSPKPTTNPTTMDANAKLILSNCFAIDFNDVVDIVGWTDPAASAAAANALCADLAKVNYNGGTVSGTTAPVEID